MPTVTRRDLFAQIRGNPAKRQQVRSALGNQWNKKPTEAIAQAIGIQITSRKSLTGSNRAKAITKQHGFAKSFAAENTSKHLNGDKEQLKAQILKAINRDLKKAEKSKGEKLTREEKRAISVKSLKSEVLKIRQGKAEEKPKRTAPQSTQTQVEQPANKTSKTKKTRRSKSPEEVEAIRNLELARKRQMANSHAVVSGAVSPTRVDLESDRAAHAKALNEYEAVRSTKKAKAKSGDRQKQKPVADPGTETLNKKLGQIKSELAQVNSDLERARAAGASGDEWRKLQSEARNRRNRATGSKPSETVAEKQPKPLDIHSIKSAQDHEAYVEQELAEAKKSGDKTRIEAWEKELKAARKRNLNQSVAKTKQQQTSLFDPLAYNSDAPLLQGLYK